MGPLQLDEEAARAGWHKVVAFVALGHATVVASYAVGSYFPLYLRDLGVGNAATVALLTGAYSAAGNLPLAVVAPVWGLLTDRFGAKRMLLRAALAGAVTMWCTALSSAPGALLAIRFVQGTLTGTSAPASALLAEVAPSRRGAIAASFVHSATQVGSTLGPVVVGVLSASLGMRGAFLTTGVLLALAAVAFYLTPDFHGPARDRHRPIEESSSSLIDSYRTLAWPSLRNILAMSVVVFALAESMNSLFALLLIERAVPNGHIPLLLGAAIGATSLVAAVTTPAAALAAARWSANALVCLGFGLIGAIAVMQSLSLGEMGLIGVRIALGVGFGIVYGCLTTMTQHVAAGAAGRVYGAAFSAQKLGVGVGPLVGSVIVALVGASTFMLATGLCVVAGVAIAAAMWIPRARRAGAAV